MKLWIHIRVSKTVMASKNVGIRIRVEQELREAFQAACVTENRQASDVLREFMALYVERSCTGLQRDLFIGSSDSVENSIRNAGKSTIPVFAPPESSNQNH